MRFLKMIFAFVLLALHAPALAQKQTFAQNSVNTETGYPRLWKKSVIRRIFLPSDRRRSDKITAEQEREWQKFLKEISKATKDGKLKCYSEADNNDILSAEEIRDLFILPSYTTLIDNPSTGKQIIKVIPREFDYRSIASMKIAEDWSYDPYTAKTKIQITRVAPLVDVVGDDGVYRGSKSMFWIPWSQFQSYFSSDPQGKPMLKELGQAIWREYFRDTGLVVDSSNINLDVNSTTIFEKAVVRKIELKPSQFLGKDYGNNLDDDTAFLPAQILYDGAVSGSLRAYKNVNNRPGTIFTLDELKKLIFIPDDTTVILDPSQNKEIFQVRHRVFPFQDVINFSFVEKWIFDVIKGETQIDYELIAPVKRGYDDLGNLLPLSVMFWVKYADARKILIRYFEYTPDDNVEMELWFDRFTQPRRRREE